MFADQLCMYRTDHRNFPYRQSCNEGIQIREDRSLLQTQFLLRGNLNHLKKSIDPTQHTSKSHPHKSLTNSICGDSFELAHVHLRIALLVIYENHRSASHKNTFALPTSQ